MNDELDLYAFETGRDMHQELDRVKKHWRLARYAYTSLDTGWLYFCEQHNLDAEERDDARGPFRRGWQSFVPEQVN